MSETGLLNPASIRRIADQIGLRPTKTRGQNFVHDANTCLLYTSDAADE